MTDTLPSETVVKEPLENNVTPPTPPTPPVEKVEEGEVAKLQKQLKQAEMEKNQLRNKLEAEERAKADAEAAKLEEQNEFKTLYEQEKAKREEIEALKEAEANSNAIKEATEGILAEYSESAKKIAQTAGISLTDTDDDSIEAFKAKLNEIQGMVGNAKVTPNNPSAPTKPALSIRNEEGVVEAELTGAKFDEFAKSMPGIAGMMGPTEE